MRFSNEKLLDLKRILFLERILEENIISNRLSVDEKFKGFFMIIII